MSTILASIVCSAIISALVSAVICNIGLCYFTETISKQFDELLEKTKKMIFNHLDRFR